MGLLLVSGILLRIFGNDIIATSSKSDRKLPIYCTTREDKKIALSFDAAWGNEDTKNILDILQKHDVRVTFFMTGGWISSFPDDVKAIAEAGHDLGNHSESHKQMSQLSADECRKEIQTAHDRVKELTGIEMTLFRPPYGDYNNTVVEVTGELGYHCVQWDVDSLDWKDLSADEITQRVLSGVKPGSIVLFHNAGEHTPEALPAILDYLLGEGYELVPISRILLTCDETYIDHTGKQCPGSGA